MARTASKSKMTICTAMVSLDHENRTVVARGPTNPLTYPEVNLLLHVFGERAVTNVTAIGEIETDNKTELEAMTLKYGKRVKEAFPGARPRLPLLAPDDVPSEPQEFKLPAHHMPEPGTPDFSDPAFDIPPPPPRRARGAKIAAE